MGISNNKFTLKDLYISMEIKDKDQLSGIYDTWIMLVKSSNSDVYKVGFIGKEAKLNRISCLFKAMLSVLYTMTSLNWKGIYIMRNKYILLEMNQRN